MELNCIILWSRLTISLAVIVGVVLANIITFLIVGGGRSSLFAEDATNPVIGKKENTTVPYINEKAKAIAECECPCHQHRKSEFPGVRCMDCYGEDCDEGPAL